MKIINYEIKKILSTKVSLFLIIFLVCYCIIYPITYVCQYKSTNQNELGMSIKDIENKYLTYKDDLIGEDIYKSLLYKNKKTILSSKYTMSITNNMNKFLDAGYFRKTGKYRSNAIDFLVEKPNEIISTEKLKLKILELKNHHMENTFEYKNLVKQNQMMQNAGDPQFIYQHFWEVYDTYETFAVFIYALFIIIIISNLFSQEQYSNMYMMLLSSSIGKKSIIKSKLVSSGIVGALGIIFINFFMGGIFLCFGSFYGFEEKLCSLSVDYAYSPYDITILYYCIIKIFYQCLAIWIVISITAFLSFKLSRTSIVIVIGLILTYLGYIINIVDTGSETVFTYFSITYGLLPKKIFYKYYGFNFFGKPITYAALYMIFGYFVIFILNLMIYLFYTKGKHNYS